MKTKLVVTLCAIAALFAACRKSSSGEEQTATVSVERCETKTFGNELVVLCFDSLVQDSRCPINANCVWQGVAQARFSFTLRNNTYRFTLSSNNVLPATHTDTTIQDYTISLVNIQPYPGSLLTVMPYAEVKIKRN